MVEYRDFGIGSRDAYWTLGRSALYLFAQKVSSYGGELRGVLAPHLRAGYERRNLN